MRMREVARPNIKPQHCAAIPHITSVTEGMRWVDTGAEMPGFDNHVYLSEQAIREAGQVLGLVDGGEHAEAIAEAAALRDMLAESEARNDELISVLQNASFVERYLDTLDVP